MAAAITDNTAGYILAWCSLPIDSTPANRHLPSMMLTADASNKVSQQGQQNQGVLAALTRVLIQLCTPTADLKETLKRQVGVDRLAQFRAGCSR